MGLQQTIDKLNKPGTGILAADESIGTIGKRFASVGLENTHENRFNYRKMLFTTNKLENYISGVILFEETLFDCDENGTRLVQPLIDKGIVLGIKTDLGLIDLDTMPGSPKEQTTLGLKDLTERSKKYYDAGARFAKFRCVFTIDRLQEKSINYTPTSYAISTNAKVLADYALISQKCGLVPIVEPEVLMDGSHSIQDCKIVTKEVLVEVYKQLNLMDVSLTHTILKPNVIRYGTLCSKENIVPNETVAEMTLSVLKDCVPSSVPMIAFLSGGMAETEATDVLELMNSKPAPWRLTFSFGRALQHSALERWAQLVKSGKEDFTEAQLLLLDRAGKNGYASVWKWCDTM